MKTYLLPHWRRASLIVIVGLSAAVIGRGAVIDNGSLEYLNAAGEPNNWFFLNSQCAGAKVKLSGEAADGERTIFVSNPQARRPGVYCGFGTNVQLEPEREYTVRFRARGAASGIRGFSLTLGNGWEVRRPFGPLAAEWKEYEVSFSLPKKAVGGNGYAAFVILSEEIAAGAWFDDFRIVENHVSGDGENSGGNAAGAAAGTPESAVAGNRELTAQAIEFAFVPQNTVPNGRFEERTGERATGWTFKWANSPGSRIELLKLESGKNAVRFVHPHGRGGGIYTAAITQVRLVPGTRYRLTFQSWGRDVHWCNIGVGEGWRQRFQVSELTPEPREFSFEFSLSPGEISGDGSAPLVIVVEDRAEEVMFTDFRIAPVEEGAVLLDTVEYSSAERLEPDMPNLLGEGAENRAQLGWFRGALQLRIENRNGNDFTLHLPDAGEVLRIVGEKGKNQIVPLPAEKCGNLFRFALQEQGAREREIAPSFADYRWIRRVGAPYAVCVQEGGERGKSLQGYLLYSGNAVAPGTELTLTLDPAVRFMLGKTESSGGRIPFFLNVSEIPPGNYRCRVLAGERELCGFAVELPELTAENRAALNVLAARVTELKAQYLRKDEMWQRNGHLSSRMFVLEKSVADLRALERELDVPGADDYFNERCELALKPAMTIAAELAGLLEKTAPPAPTITGVAGEFKLRNHWPEAEVNYSDGTRKRTAIFMNGYGHFEDAARALERFGELGVNSIQLEIGPAYLLSGENPDGSFQLDFRYLDEFLLPALQRAADSGIMVNLLLSPHYLPGWFQERHPEIGSPSGWLLEYEVNHPEARRMMAGFLDALLPRLASAPGRGALCGITVSNEPIYFGFQLEKPFVRDLFRRELEKKFNNIDELNELLGRRFESRESALDAAATDPGMRYLFFTFKREMFVRWHGWLAEQVKNFLPEVPVSAKLMAGRALTTEFASDGVDLDLLDICFDQSGQDNGMSYFPVWNEPVAMEYITALLADEYQYSRSGKSISNTENHVIPDYSRAPQPGKSVYVANFLQYLSGAANLVTWVWKEKNEHGLGYNISFRPDCLIAQAEAAFAANADYAVFRRFCDSVPEIAIYYSEASQLQNPDSFPQVKVLYGISTGSGHRVTFLSDRQLAAGEFGALRTILVPGQTHVPETSVEALRKFIASGGELVMTPDSLQFNAFDMRRTFELDGARQMELSSEEDFRQAIAARHPLQFPLRRLGGETGYLFHREISDGADGTWIALVNFSHATGRIGLGENSDVSFRDLLSGELYPAEFNLPSLTPLLLVPYREK